METNFELKERIDARSTFENGGAIVGHGSGGMIRLRAA
jgi:hypothetical protein